MTENAEKAEHTNQPEPDDQEISLIDLLVALAHHKKLVFGLPVLMGMIGVAVSLLLTPMFSSTVRIMPPQQQQSAAAAMLGQLGGLAGAAGGLAGLKTPADLYVGILGSRTIADNLINSFGLKERYQSKTMDDARKSLAKATQISSGKKDGLISVAVEDEDPAFAARLANAYVAELIKLTQTMAITEASQRRMFFEAQLKDAKEQLTNAELALRKTQESTGLIQPDGQVQAILTSIAQLRGNIAAKEVQLNAMRTFAAPQNPELLRAQEELRSLQAQLASMEKKRPSRDGDFAVPIGRIPEAGIEYVRSLRDVKYYETMFEMMAKQFELAKVDESREAALIQVLDEAVPAERKSKPKRALIVVTLSIAGAVLGMLAALVFEYMKKSSQAKLASQRLYRAWKGE